MLDTKDVADKVIAKMGVTYHPRGYEQFQSFIVNMENKEERIFYHSIKKNTVTFFKPEQAASSSKEKALKGDCQLFKTFIFHLISEQTNRLARTFQAQESVSICLSAIMVDFTHARSLKMTVIL